MTTLLGLCFCVTAADPAGTDRTHVVVAVGAAGTDDYETEFRADAERWAAAAATAGAGFVRVGLDGDARDETDFGRLRSAVGEAPGGDGPLWIVLIGHGTFDGREAKFNLRGPDLSAAELGTWLDGVTRPVVIVNGASASGPFVAKLSGPRRAIVTATRSGDEQNATRFGSRFAEAVADPAADLDKDGQTSVLEAFLTAAARVAEFYESESRLATEHALLDDNGDRLGTPADWFRGVRATRRAKDGAALDGGLARRIALVLSNRERALPPETRRRRDRLEDEIAALREKKTSLAEDDYYRRLEPLMIELGTLYGKANKEPVEAKR